MAADVLGRRALNRATLARQHLLHRVERPALAEVAHLVGLQAQVPLDPYVALWSRLDGFVPGELAGLLVDRAVVRTVVMRATIHLVTVDDCVLLRPLVQPVLDRELARHREHAPALRGVDLAPVLDVAMDVMAAAPRTPGELRAALGERFPDLDAAALAYACRNRLALVQVPPRGVWGRAAGVRWTTAEAWLGRPLTAAPSIDDIVVRYLAVFGPAAVADVAAWSGLTGLGEVVDRLRPRLRAFTDDRGRRLVDLPDAPRPGPDVPAPARFLPQYDNVLLSHADRARFVADDRRRRLLGAAALGRGTVLHDGGVCATWSVGGGTLVVRHDGPLPREAAADIAAEGLHLLRFLEAGPPHDVRFEAVG